MSVGDEISLIPPSDYATWDQDDEPAYLGVDSDYVAPYVSRRTSNVADRAEREERQAIEGLGDRIVYTGSGIETSGGRRSTGRGRARARRTGRTATGVLPIYTDQDTYGIFMQMGTTMRAEVELQLVEAGLLHPDDVRGGGVWSTEAQRAMAVVMTTANEQGLTWSESLNLYRANPPAGMADDEDGPGSGRAPYVAPTYLAPDYATLAQGVKQVFRQQLNREPRDFELQFLAEQLERDYRAAFDAEVAADRADYNLATVAVEEGTEGLTGGTVRSVDPVARLNQAFDERYGPEMNRLERIGEVEQSQASLLASIGLIGGDR